ncbi:uncharacterized protein LOC130677949 [Microplitis mediator]|uniref:uncharacterized protein LOC130677949 n=1 Tax=Microplitis mediator TaxID=375433 RepID=UPI00255601D0|nr:uncharacterized protein LOC130677949 [Microplitis mediator]
MSNIFCMIFMIFVTTELSESFNVHLTCDIDEIVKFVSKVGVSHDNDKIKEAAEELDKLEIDGNKNYEKIIDKYFVEMPKKNIKDKDINKLKGLIKKIDEAWSQYGTKELGNDDKVELADLPGTLSELYKFYIGNYEKDFPSRVAQDKRPSVCEAEVNNQIRLEKLHQAVVLSELRAFILNLKGAENSLSTASNAVIHSEQYILATRNGFKAVENFYYRCDPEEHIRGETFSEFLGLFQGVIVNTEETDYGCSSDCEDIINKRYKNDGCDQSEDGGKGYDHCPAKPCKGQLVRCFYVGDAEACELDESSDRRFQWVKIENKRNDSYGNSTNECDGTIVNLRDAKKKYSDCSTCGCVCAEEDGNSTAIRAISSIPQFADIEKNMVITGVRFVEKDGLFHIQIEQSELGAYGEIIEGTEEWKELDDFEYVTARLGGFKIKTDEGERQLVEEDDFAFITDNNRGFHLDELTAPDGHVIVGARIGFDWIEDAVELTVLSWPFDYLTGKLENPVKLSQASNLEWINWKNSQKRVPVNMQRNDWLLIFFDEPIKSPKENSHFPPPHTMIDVQATGFREDMAQHTIPYIDLQPVTYPSVKIPLRGLEIIHRSYGNYGGFLSLKLHTYNFTSHFGYEMTADDLKKYKRYFNDDLKYEIPRKI